MGTNFDANPMLEPALLLVFLFNLLDTRKIFRIQAYVILICGLILTFKFFKLESWL